jgi:hypothetical protein
VARVGPGRVECATIGGRGRWKQLTQSMHTKENPEIEKVVAQRRLELVALSRAEVAHEFDIMFQIRPDARSDKENLIERILIKVRAALEGKS